MNSNEIYDDIEAIIKKHINIETNHNVYSLKKELCDLFNKNLQKSNEKIIKDLNNKLIVYQIIS